MSALNPTEVDRLQVFLAAEMARRLLARGLPLNAAEATALIADELHLAARAGNSYVDVAAAGMHALSAAQVMPGVPEIVAQISVEVLLDEGSRLIVLRHPIRTSAEQPSETSPGSEAIGGVRLAEEAVSLVAERPRLSLTVENTSRRIVRVTSHFPFWRVNHRLCFDRNAARGYRLDLPAGSNVRWGPGETRQVTLVLLSGEEGA